MISKKQLLQKVRELSGVYLSAAASLDALIEWVESIPDDQPDLLPFQWPIPDGMEVVTRDGRKVEQLVRFEGLHDDQPLCGVLENTIEFWTQIGNYFSSGEESYTDLFLRRKEKKVWVLEWESDSLEKYLFTFKSYKEAKDFSETVNNPAIYEATLKPVV